MFLYFYVAALYNLGFTICSSYMDQVWPPLQKMFHVDTLYITFALFEF